MRVVNRDGELVSVSYDAIRSRILELCTPSERNELDIDVVIVKTIAGLKDNITTGQLDELSAMVCASLQSQHYLYDNLAGKILVSSLQKNIRRIIGTPQPATFSQKVKFITKQSSNVFNTEFVYFVLAHADALDRMIDYSRDLEDITYFSFRTLEKAYLTKVNDHVVETPQDMWMRVAIAIHFPRTIEEVKSSAAVLGSIKQVYDDMSTGLYTHATPTLFNAGMKHEQLSSCYLLGTDDSLSGIYKTISDCAQISKWAGGIGVHISNVRSKGSTIKSTNGKSDGIVPMLKVYNETARYCNQSGRRKGSIAVYLEPWHADILDFIELRKNTGAESVRARDLFLALWIPDLFMQCVIEDRIWYLMSPDTCPGLSECYGEEFELLYNKYVRESRYVKSVPARTIWMGVLQSQIETGTPYIMFKDTVNRKCNQNNVGTIKSSNLCAEITQFSDHETYAVCNLASIAVNRFWDFDSNRYDFNALHRAAEQVTYNLNRVIDINFYPTPETKASNLAMRPIGIGVQGFGDLYNIMNVTYESDVAIKLDTEIMETIYHGALTASANLATKFGSYERFNNSMFSRGVLQFDLYENKTDNGMKWSWGKLKENIVTTGIRNSMLTALMPTASTSQILGNSEGFEPVQSNVFKRTTLAGEFLVVNKNLMKDLMKLGIWTEEMRTSLLRNNGSISNIDKIPTHIKDLYKTVWEIKQRSIIDHAIARSPFVDQSQSMNLFFDVPNYQKLNSALVYAWKSGLKTGVYYLRTKPAAEAIKTSTIMSHVSTSKKADEDAADIGGDDASFCRMEHGCVSCSS